MPKRQVAVFNPSETTLEEFKAALSWEARLIEVADVVDLPETTAWNWTAGRPYKFRATGKKVRGKKRYTVIDAFHFLAAKELAAKGITGSDALEKLIGKFAELKATGKFDDDEGFFFVAQLPDASIVEYFGPGDEEFSRFRNLFEGIRGTGLPFSMVNLSVWFHELHNRIIAHRKCQRYAPKVTFEAVGVFTELYRLSGLTKGEAEKRARATLNRD